MPDKVSDQRVVIFKHAKTGMLVRGRLLDPEGQEPRRVMVGSGEIYELQPADELQDMQGSLPHVPADLPVLAFSADQLAQDGKIETGDVNLRYRIGEPLVLRLKGDSKGFYSLPVLAYPRGDFVMFRAGAPKVLLRLT